MKIWLSNKKLQPQWEHHQHSYLATYSIRSDKMPWSTAEIEEVDASQHQDKTKGMVQRTKKMTNTYRPTAGTQIYCSLNI